MNFNYTDTITQTSNTNLPLGLTIVDEIEAMLAYWDKNQICRFANNAYRRWFGHSRDEMVDRMTLKELLGTLYESNEHYIQNALKGDIQHFEREVRLPNGELRITRASYYPDISNGNVRGFTSHVVDITDYVRTKQHLEDHLEMLKHSEERYHNMIAEVQDFAIILLDTEGNIENWNKGAGKIKGYRASEIIGENFRKFYTKTDLDMKKPDALLQEANHEGRTQDQGWRVRKDGTTFFANVTITALHNNVGKVIGYSKVTSDITNQKFS